MSQAPHEPAPEARVDIPRVRPKGVLSKSVFRQLQRGKALEPMAFLEGHYLLALDGTGYFSSTQIHCASCLHKVHRNGSITYSHQMFSTVVSSWVEVSVNP